MLQIILLSSFKSFRVYKLFFFSKYEVISKYEFKSYWIYICTSVLKFLRNGRENFFKRTFLKSIDMKMQKRKIPFSRQNVFVPKTTNTIHYGSLKESQVGKTVSFYDKWMLTDTWSIFHSRSCLAAVHCLLHLFTEWWILTFSCVAYA